MDENDPRYCPPHQVRIWWPAAGAGYTVADPSTMAELRRLLREGSRLEAGAATLRAHMLAVGIAARNYLACYPDGRQHGRDGKRAAEALLTALEEAGL